MNTDSSRSLESGADATSKPIDAAEAAPVTGATSVAAAFPASSTANATRRVVDLASIAVAATADNSGRSPKSTKAASAAKLAASPTSPAFLAINTVSMALLGLGIILIVGACFSPTPWLPLQPMVVASAYLALTSLGLLALLLVQAMSANYVHGNKRATAIWGTATLVLAVIAALVFAVYRPTLEGTIALGAPRVFWLVFGGLLLVAGGIVYQPANHLGKPGVTSGSLISSRSVGAGAGLGTGTVAGASSSSNAMDADASTPGAGDVSADGGVSADFAAGTTSSLKGTNASATGAGTNANAGAGTVASTDQVDVRMTSAQHFSERRWSYFGTFLVLAAWTIYRMVIDVFEWYDMLAAFGALIALSMFLWGTLHHLLKR